MKEDLIPSDGEILVETDSGINSDFMYTFANKLGYEYLGEWEYGLNLHMIKVPVGDEGYIINNLVEKYPQFIKGGSRRYPLVDKRIEFNENLEDMIADLGGFLEEEEFKTRLEAIVNYIKNFKD